MKPVQTFRDGAIGLSVWERTGSKGPFFEFTISRSFKNKEGKSAYSGSFREYDAESIRRVIEQAVEDIRTRNAGTGNQTVEVPEAGHVDDATTVFLAEGL